MHYDEPFWMVRGDFLIRSLIEGNLEDLQNNHWMLAPMEGERRIFNSYIATGSGTAFLTGLGRLFIPLAPGGEGIGGLVAELFFSRLLHVLCSALTPLLLLLLARRLGLPWMGQIALLSYFTFDPILQEMGSLAHLESFLTLTVPVALLLFGVSHLQQSLPLCLVAGAVFGLAFVNRINGGVVAVAALAYIVLRLLLQRHASQSVRSLLWREGVRLGLLCLVGWAVFVLCFPPLWRSPVFGFTDFLYQQAALTGSGADFEAAAVFLWTDSGLRFLFVLFGLAGSCTVAYALDRWGPHSAKVARLVAGTILVLSMWAATSIVIRQQDSLRRTRDFYGKLHARNFSRIDVPRFPASYIRTDADPGGPALRIATGSTHTRLFYLGVLLTDGRRFREADGCEPPLERKSECEKGDWRMERLSRHPRTPSHAIRHRGVVAWPCGE